MLVIPMIIILKKPKAIVSVESGNLKGVIKNYTVKIADNYGFLVVLQAKS